MARCALVLLFSAVGTPRAAAQGVDVARYAGLLQMADHRELDSALVLDMLARGSSAERVAAARAIGQVHGSALAPRLVSLLADRDSAVGANAAFSLGLLRDSLAVGALTSALDARPTVAAQSAWALGVIGAPATAAIDSALRREVPRSADVTAALLLAAAKLHPVPAELVAPYLANASASVRWAAVYAYARPYVAAGVRRVVPLARDSAAGVRALVARALAHQAAGDSLASLALPVLDTLSRDSSALVRVNAIRALATYGLPARAAILAALHDQNANVRITAAQGLGTVLAARRKAWGDAWAADTAFAYRRAVLISALSLNLVLEAADEDNPDGWRHFADWRFRAAVAEAGAAATNIQRMREVSLPLSRDSDPRVRVAAFAAIAPYADSAREHPWRREFLYFAVPDWDYAVRETAISALRTHATAAEAGLVVRSYAHTAGDTVNDARVATVGLLRSAWTNDSASFSDSLQAAIRRLPVPPDQPSRDAARGFALLAAWSSAPPVAPRPRSWYEHVVNELVVPALGGHRTRVAIATVHGTLSLELAPADAPLTVNNFLTLARAGAYNGVRWHRVVPNFVVQDGDARGDGNGSPGYTIRDELNRIRYARGTLGMALSGPDTGGSQYFITLSPQPHLDAGYTAFGRVVAGFAALDETVQGDEIVSVREVE